MEHRGPTLEVYVDLDATVCFCFHVSKRKIVHFLRRERPARISQISNCLSAGTGCGWCIRYLERLHREIVVEEERGAGGADVEADAHAAGRRTYLAAGRRRPDE